MYLESTISLLILLQLCSLSETVSKRKEGPWREPGKRLGDGPQPHPFSVGVEGDKPVDFKASPTTLGVFFDTPLLISTRYPSNCGGT